MRPQKLRNNPICRSASGCGEPKNDQVLPSRPVNLFKQSVKFFYNFLHKKVLSEPGEKGNASFQSRPRMKVELTRENGRKTPNTGSKGYV